MGDGAVTFLHGMAIGAAIPVVLALLVFGAFLVLFRDVS